MRLPRPLHLRLMPLLLLLPVAGCGLPAFMTFPPQVRGNRVDADALKELVPGTSTRADALSLIGSPTTKAPFDDNSWIYIGEVTKPVIGGTQEVLDQEVVLLTFDDKGVLKVVTKKGPDDSLPVAVVARTTPSPGSNASILQQLLGNVGRFSPNAGPNTGGNSGGNRSGSGVGY
ncbi:MAG TPA: outer membrane protein assembly factor BamE [Acetobacteraceae bacterium]